MDLASLLAHLAGVSMRFPPSPFTVHHGSQLIVDGVGFPSVGSIVGVDNADVAKVARAPVLLVCCLAMEKQEQLA